MAFNKMPIISKPNVDAYGNPQLVQVSSETHQIFKSKIVLNGIPDKFSRVTITDDDETIYVEKFDTDVLIGNQFKVSYSTGVINFPVELEGKSVLVSYYSKGIELVSAERIYTKIGDNGDVIETLDDKVAEMIIMKQNYDNATHVDLVKKVILTYTATQDTTSFVLDANNYNPLIDIVWLYYKNTILLENKQYVITGTTVTLNEWTLPTGDTIDIVVERAVKDLPPAGTNGGDLMNGSVGETKLSSDVQLKLNKAVIIQDYIFTATQDNTSTFTVESDIFNPVSDIIDIYKDNLKLTKDINYTLEGQTVTLFEGLKINEYVEYRITKNTSNSVPFMPDGSLIHNRTIPKRKLTLDLQNEITNSTTEIANAMKTGIIGNYINVVNQDDYDKTDASVALNRICSTIQAGDIVILTDDTVHIKNTINVTLPINAKLIIDAEVIVHGDFNGFNITGNSYYFSVFIKSIKNLNPLNYTVNNSSAFQMGTGYNGDVTINRIDGFKNALYLRSRGGNGIQYVKFAFSHFVRCVNGILFDANENSSTENWINENTFTGGRLECNNGIKSIATTNSNKNIYNNNKFYNIGFEGIIEYCIDVVQFRYNSFKNFRMLESLPSGLWIREGLECSFNKYEASHTFPYTKAELQYCSEISAFLTDPSTGEKISNKAEVQWKELSQKHVMCFNTVADNDFYSEAYFAIKGGTVKQVKCSGYIDIMLSTSHRILSIQPCLEFPGYQVIISVGHSTAGGGLGVSIPTGSGIKWWLSDGVYKISYTNETWNKVQLSTNPLSTT